MCSMLCVVPFFIFACRHCCNKPSNKQDDADESQKYMEDIWAMTGLPTDLCPPPGSCDGGTENKTDHRIQDFRTSKHGNGTEKCPDLTAANTSTQNIPRNCKLVSFKLHDHDKWHSVKQNTFVLTSTETSASTSLHQIVPSNLDSAHRKHTGPLKNFI